MVKVRCLITGRYYTNKRYLKQAREHSKFVRDHYDEQISYLQVAVAKAFGPEASKKRSKTMKQKHANRPDLKLVSAESIRKGVYGNKKNLKKFLKRCYDAKDRRLMKDGKQILEIEHCERKKSTGVVQV